jgi:hypothetical protein
VVSERPPSFVDFYSQLKGDLLLIFGTTSLWLGGTSVPSSWLHNYYENIIVLSCLYCIMNLIVVHEL